MNTQHNTKRPVRRKVVKVNPDFFKEAQFNVTLTVSGLRAVQECDCWLCEQITDTLPSKETIKSLPITHRKKK